MTSCLFVQLRMEDEDLPLPGEQHALVDSRGPQGVVEVVEVRLLRLRDVGGDVAVGEGEDYPDVPAWRQSHEAFWADSGSEIAAHLGLDHWTLGDDEIVVVERFRLL